MTEDRGIWERRPISRV